MHRQKPSRSSRKDDQDPDEVVERTGKGKGKEKAKPKPKPKPKQRRAGLLDPERVKKSFMGRYRPAMKTARPRPLMSESSDGEDSNLSQDSEESMDNVKRQLLASDSSDDSFVVARKAADPYSPPDSEDDVLLANMAHPDSSSDDDIHVKMPVPQPAGSQEGLKPACLTFCEKEALLRKELNIPKSDKRVIKKGAMVKVIPSTSNGNKKDQEVAPGAPEMQQDEMKEQGEKDTGDKTAIKPVEAEVYPNQGPEVGEPKKEEQEPTENLKKSASKEKEDKAQTKIVDKQDGDKEAVAGKDPTEGIKPGLKRSPKAGETLVESDDNAGPKPPVAKCPKEGD